MKPGRIESYVHSDRITENKAGVLVKVECDTDFAAKTDEFKAFSARVAKMACGFGAPEVIADDASAWDDLVQRVGYLGDTDTLETQRLALSKELREDVVVRDIIYLSL